MTATACVALVPRDGLACKDGRGWHTSVSGRGHALDWPWPSTMLGAIRSAWGRGEEARRGASFGPDEWRDRTSAIQLRRTLAVRRGIGARWSAEHRVWPVPADALFVEDRPEVRRLEPVPPTLVTLGRDDDEAREALWRPLLDSAVKPVEPPRWWSDGDLSSWLAGRPVQVRHRQDTLAVSRRLQVHVGIRSEELTADEGVLFSHDVVETLERGAEWAIAVEVVLPPDEVPGVATLGSDGRLVRIERLPDTFFDPPALVLEAFRATSAGVRLVVVTPACFAGGWVPDGLEQRGGQYRGRLAGLDREVVLRAAIVPRPLPVSGWDIAARTPKPTARMAAPGAVYFLQRADGRPFDETDARPLWLAALGARTDEGFGRVVPGVWNARRATP